MEIFGMGFGEILMIALVALIVLGPERLPEAARTVGRGIAELRRTVEPARTMWRDISNEINSVASTTTTTFSAATGTVTGTTNGKSERIHPVLEMMTPEERVEFAAGGDIPQRIADQLAAQANGTALDEDDLGNSTAAVELPHLDYPMPHAETTAQHAIEELYYPPPGNSDTEGERA